MKEGRGFSDLLAAFCVSGSCLGCESPQILDCSRKGFEDAGDVLLGIEPAEAESDRTAGELVVAAECTDDG